MHTLEHSKYTHTLDTQACMLETHTPHSCMCCKHVETRAHTHLMKACTRRTCTWSRSLQHGDGFTHTHTHTHTTLCVDPQRSATHIQIHGLRPTGMRWLHTQSTRTHTHMFMQTHRTENIYTLYGTLACKGHTQTLTLLAHAHTQKSHHGGAWVAQRLSVCLRLRA